MRILVYEFVTGGGLAGKLVPRSLLAEGLAMRTALLEDLAALKGHTIVASTDARFVRRAPRGVEMVTIDSGSTRTIDELIAASDAVWLVAPESNRCLERLAGRIERRGKTLLGPRAAAVRLAADKAGLPERLRRIGIRHPETIPIGPRTNIEAAAHRLGYPLIVKPATGASCRGVRLIRDRRGLSHALDTARRTEDRGPLLMQAYVRGRAASVSLMSDGNRAVPLAVNAQRIAASAGFRYCGGWTPLEHRLSTAAADAALRTCTAIPGLRGYVGVDLVLTDEGPVVIEVNPRVTTSYVGVRAAIDENLAGMALDACEGRLPGRPVVRRRARFSAAGRVVSM